MKKSEEKVTLGGEMTRRQFIKLSGKGLIGLTLLVGFPPFLHAQDLSLNADDLLIEHRPSGGFHLFIRKKPDVNSVLLVESTRDPTMQEHNFAFRAREWNPVNGDEIRLLDGIPLPRGRFFSLVSSTVINHEVLGQAFHIYIPYVVYFGFPPARHGRIYITDGAYFNIRTFNLPYADYSGAFMDNPFILEATQMPTGIPPGNFMAEAVAAYANIADFGKGNLVHSTADNIVDDIKTLLERERGRGIDIVICLDTTGSMRPFVEPVRQKLIPMLQELIVGYPSFRIGMVQFKDYFEEYLTRVTHFTSDFSAFQRSLNNVRARNGGDIPEAVYEALHDGATQFPWAAESKLIILIGDAPPHPRPRGRITRAMVEREVAERDITVHAMVLPN